MKHLSAVVIRDKMTCPQMNDITHILARIPYGQKTASEEMTHEDIILPFNQRLRALVAIQPAKACRS
jgi:hypothetical protein